jgi:hypothetical protein
MKWLMSDRCGGDLVIIDETDGRNCPGQRRKLLFCRGEKGASKRIAVCLRQEQRHPLFDVVC